MYLLTSFVILQAPLDLRVNQVNLDPLAPKVVTVFLELLAPKENKDLKVALDHLDYQDLLEKTGFM